MALRAELFTRAAITAIMLADEADMPLIAVDAASESGAFGLCVVAFGHDAHRLLEWVNRQRAMEKREINLP